MLLVLFVHGACCQTTALPGPDQKDKTGDKDDIKSSSLKFGLNYLSNNVFMGRADSVTTPTIVPDAKFTLKSGIYFSASLYYVPNKKSNKLDGGSLSAGYDFDITADLLGMVSYTKQFYSASSTEITSSIRNSFSANLNYEIGEIMSAAVNTDYIINKQGTDEFFVGLDLSHDFIKKGVSGSNDLLLISPTITINTGKPQLSGYSVLDCEISIPGIYKTGNLIFQLMPIYAITIGELPAVISTMESRKSSIFYFEAGITLKF